MESKVFGITKLYLGESGSLGFYNSQELGLARALTGLGWKCVLIFPDLLQKDIEESQIESNIVLVKVPCRHIKSHSKYDWSIIKKYGVKILQIGSDNQIFAASLVDFCQKNGILFHHYVGTLTSIGGHSIEKKIMWVASSFTRKAQLKQMVFAKNGDVAQQLISLGATNVSICPVGLDLTQIEKVEGNPLVLRAHRNIMPDKKVLLFVGRLSNYKHPYDFIDILHELGDEYLGIMIGDGDEREGIESKIVEYDIADRVIQISKIPNSEVQYYYALSDYFINLNPNEIFGMSILEAMYQGTQVVAIHAPGPDTIIQDAVNGYLVNDVHEVIETIRTRQCCDKDIICKRIVDNFTWQKVAELYDKKYASCI